MLLDATGSSDPDGDPLTDTWSQNAGPAVTLTDPVSATSSFTAPTGPATLGFTVEVCDPEPLCDTATRTGAATRPFRSAHRGTTT